MASTSRASLSRTSGELVKLFTPTTLKFGAAEAPSNAGPLYTQPARAPMTTMIEQRRASSMNVKVLAVYEISETHSMIRGPPG